MSVDEPFNGRSLWHADCSDLGLNLNFDLACKLHVAGLRGAALLLAVLGPRDLLDAIEARAQSA